MVQRITPVSLAVGAIVLLAVGSIVWLKWPTKEPRDPTHVPAVLTPTPGVPWFLNKTGAAGLRFVHYDPATKEHYIQETMGSGVAWIDYDNDGWPDLFCVQDSPVRPESTKDLPTHKLYRNNRDGTFHDITEAVGLAHSGFGMGAAVGDFDNDGYDDLLVTYMGGVALYHNELDGKGGRRFVDVTKKAGLHNPHWATSAAWGDIDGDGLLDLYMCNYCEVDMARYPVCKDDRTGLMMSCPPSHFACVPHRLYKNNGNGLFTDITRSSGIGVASPSPGLAVAMIDLDGDGKLDIYVANDMKPAFLFHNQGGGKFVEKALLSGCAFGPDGTLVAGMGIAIGDVDASGWPSLFVTNFDRKPSVLYLNQGKMWFKDTSMPSGLGGPSIPWLKFGCEFLDADLDGQLDAAVANGHIHRDAQKAMGTPYAQPAQLFQAQGKGKFRDVSEKCGEYFREGHVGRGVAVADFNNDGKPDVVFSNNGGPMGLLENRTETENTWIRLELIGDGRKSNRNAIGARVEIEAGGTKQTRWVIGGGSYLSASERRMCVGLGKARKAERVSVVWPSGSKQEFRDLQSGREYRMVEGKEAEGR